MNEPIEVEARQEADGELRPTAFVWRGRRLAIRDLGRRWQEDGERRFLVMTDRNQVYELAYSLAEGSWRLVRRMRGPGERRGFV